jgi:hypothetical protein
MWKERKGARDYLAEMESVGNSKNTEEGLIFLWAMEKVGLLVSCSLPALERPVVRYTSMCRASFVGSSKRELPSSRSRQLNRW